MTDHPEEFERPSAAHIFEHIDAAHRAIARIDGMSPQTIEARAPVHAVIASAEATTAIAEILVELLAAVQGFIDDLTTTTTTTEGTPPA